MKSKGKEATALGFLIAFFLVVIFQAVFIIASRPGDEPYVPDDGEFVSDGETPSLTDAGEQNPDADEQKPDAATITMGGDVMVYERKYTAARTGDGTYDFTPFLSEFQGVLRADYNIINLETPVDAFGENRRISSYPRFNAPREILPALKSAGVDLCNMANNHCIDYGFDGLCETAGNVDSFGLERVGAYISQEEAGKPFIRNINGINVGIVSYTWSLNGFSLPADKKFAVKMGAQRSTIPYMREGVRELKAAGAEFIIVSLHWGKEYSDTWVPEQPAVAKALCEEGADVIMGHHSHSVQPIKKLRVTREDGQEREALVIYSLGNLFAYQKNVSKTDQGMVVSIKIERGDDGGVYLSDAYYIPTYLRVMNGKADADTFRLVQLGKLVRSGDASEKEKQAYNRVRGIIGDEIPCYDDISDVPDEFYN